jgi:hypothetical protein
MLTMVKSSRSKYRLPFILKYIFKDASKDYRHFSALRFVKSRVEEDDFSRIGYIILFRRVKYSQNELLIKTEEKEKFLEKLGEIMDVS